MDNPANNYDKTDEIFRRLEPHLKCGLSLHKACLQAQIPKSTAYDLYRNNETFSERIDISRNYYSVLVTSIVTKELERICSKQDRGKKLQPLEVRLVQWVATNSRALKAEYGDEPEKLDEEIKEDDAIVLLQKLISDCRQDTKPADKQTSI